MSKTNVKVTAAANVPATIGDRQGYQAGAATERSNQAALACMRMSAPANFSMRACASCLHWLVSDGGTFCRTVLTTLDAGNLRD
jgi:hypothetical protein